jgi:hypothetical protein
VQAFQEWWFGDTARGIKPTFSLRFSKGEEPEGWDKRRVSDRRKVVDAIPQLTAEAWGLELMHKVGVRCCGVGIVAAS